MSKDTGAVAGQRYEKTTAFRWTERAFEFLRTGQRRAEIQQIHPGVETSHVWGQCPRCGHHIDDWQPLSAVTGLIGSRRPDSAAHNATTVEAVDVGCGCGTVHPNAPAETTGCGVTFRIEFEPVPGATAPEQGS